MRKNLLMISAALAAVIINACKPEPVTPTPKPEPDPDPVPEQEHKHKFAKVNGQAATVAAPGWKDYYKCTDTYEPCGLFWEDSKGNTLIGDSQALEAWKSEGGRGYIPKLDPPHEGAGANCYIVAPGASVTFPALRGVSDDILEGIASTEVLWETFNTDVTPNTGDVVASASVSPDAKSITVTAGSKDGWFLAVEGADNGGYWFPCPGQIQAANKAMKEVGEQGFYANSASGNFINSMNIICIKIESWLGDLGPCILPIENQWVGYADGQSVRCVKQ